MISLQQKDFFNVAHDISVVLVLGEWALRTDKFVMAKARGGVRTFSSIDSAVKLCQSYGKNRLMIVASE